MRYEWTNGDRTITVDARNQEEALISLVDIVLLYYPDTTVAEWEEA